MKCLVQFLKLKKMLVPACITKVAQSTTKPRKGAGGWSRCIHAESIFTRSRYCQIPPRCSRSSRLAESFAKDTSNCVKCGGGFLLKLHKLTKKDCTVVYNKTYSQSAPELPPNKDAIKLELQLNKMFN